MLDKIHVMRYRASSRLAVLGCAGLLFTGYVFTYSAGWVPVRLFPRADDFLLSAPGVWLYLLMMATFGLSLVFLSRCQVEVSDKELTYWNPFKCTSVRWEDVTEVIVRGGACNVEVRSSSARIRLDGRFRRARELKVEVLRHVSPDRVRLGRGVRKSEWLR